jgi:hypothetical protein
MARYLPSIEQVVPQVQVAPRMPPEVPHIGLIVAGLTVEQEAALALL